MKYKGQKVANTNVEYVVFPRGDNNIVFIAKPVVNFDEFEKLYPEPKPPLIQYPETTGKPPENDYTDATYRQRMQDFMESRYYWLILTTIKDSPDIEWETINMDLPGSYKNFETELGEAEFLPAEVNRIREAVSKVNALDERQLDEARKSFLASLQAQQAS